MKKKIIWKLSIGEFGRQQTSTKFHDLVLNLKFQNSRVLETIVFLALFSRRKVSVNIGEFKLKMTSVYAVSSGLFIKKTTLKIELPFGIR